MVTDALLPPDFQPSAAVIADSINPAGHRLTTLEVQLHRFVLAELNTHRALSRNAASSRAIPVQKMLATVRNDPAVPLEWPAEQRGMQGGTELPDTEANRARSTWLHARNAAVFFAEQLTQLGVHKSVVNRILEPFLFTTVIVSATDWTGFFAQRCSPLAQPELRVAAERMRLAIEASTPTPIPVTGWHLPYILDEDRAAVGQNLLWRISAARCARVSYRTHDGRRDHQADLDLYQRLVTADPPHASPLEHVATPAVAARGNFVGWAQLRHLMLVG